MRTTQTTRWMLAGAVTVGLGCSLGCSAPPPEVLPTPPAFVFDDGGTTLLTSPFLDPQVGAAPTTLPESPPAISGGTLEVLRSGYAAVVADPDRDRVVVVDLIARSIHGSIDLPRGAQPTRIVEDDHGRVHVVLRGTGEILSFDLFAMDASTRRSVCAMPRGAAYDAATDDLLVACRSGELVTLPAAGGAVTRTVMVERDLRDVVVGDGRVFVSLFRRAELLTLDGDGAIVGRTSPVDSRLGMGFVDETGAFVESAFEPGVAWRTISASTDGSEPMVAMVHQRSSDGEVQPSPGGYGGGGRGDFRGCESSIVGSSVTFFSVDGTPTRGPDLSGATLPVDVAISPGTRDQQLVVVVAAANESGVSSIQTFRRAWLEGASETDCMFQVGATEELIRNPTSAAFLPDGRLVVLQREPGQLMILRDLDPSETVRWVRDDLAGGIGEGADGTITIGTEARFDTGHAVFHGNSGAFLACASCHPEGGDDGRTWRFGGIGPRRTPAMHGDLRGTEPFHWDGDMRDLSHLVHDVFTGRMSGPELNGGQVLALGNWLDELPAPRPALVDRAAVLRGRTVFDTTAGCASCHSGALLTNNGSFDVGSGGTFQVPSLIGVADRLPVMHDGCAETLRQRFLPECGGAAHGNVAALTEQQIGDLVAYLESL